MPNLEYFSLSSRNLFQNILNLPIYLDSRTMYNEQEILIIKLFNLTFKPIEMSSGNVLGG